MAFLSTQRKMRSRPSLRQATKARPRRHLRPSHLTPVVPAQERANASTLQSSTQAMTPRAQDLQSSQSVAIPAYPRRARAAGGPVDNALYTCGCGCMFEAHVCADVDCPRCGSEQSW